MFSIFGLVLEEALTQESATSKYLFSGDGFVTPSASMRVGGYLGVLLLPFLNFCFTESGHFSFPLLCESTAFQAVTGCLLAAIPCFCMGFANVLRKGSFLLALFHRLGS